jgi:dTDP-4-amino-4,6-dideoxygalactose transaminase
MPVFIGSIPNTQEDDVTLCKKILRNEIDSSNSFTELKRILGPDYLFFDKGRDSLYFFLKLLNLKEGDEVITQAFTCVAVVAPILWAGATPIYVDIERSSFNINLELLKEKITDKTKVIIIQHTFGNLVNMEIVRNMVDEVNKERSEERKIYIVEDCAHIFSRNLEQLHIGKYSDSYFFSFSQDKSISCTQGAAFFVKNQKLLESAKSTYLKLPPLSKKEAEYNARYIILWNLIKKYYFTTLIPFTNITIGRILIMLFRFFGLIKKQASSDTLEFKGIKRMSNIQASLLINQIFKSEKFNHRRKMIVEKYNEGLDKVFKFNSQNTFLLRYPILLSNREQIRKELLKEKIIAGSWYSTPVFPLRDEIDLGKVKYLSKSCPNAEKVGKHVLNLPTGIEVNERDIAKIIEIVNTFAKPINF